MFLRDKRKIIKNKPKYGMSLNVKIEHESLLLSQLF